MVETRSRGRKDKQETKTITTRKQLKHDVSHEQLNPQTNKAVKKADRVTLTDHVVLNSNV